ncbi:MAG TPA: hypothetical protein VD969_23140 [Symbiobacteriaceae bacterium]|nr:hypothetical protein [Symbiobacteriaceae bacterium]
MKLSVPPIPKRDDVGGGALPAIHAVLRNLGAQIRYEELLVTSGAAFSFVWDNAPVYEPLRDLHPQDSVTLAAQSAGFTGRWLVDLPADETLGQLSAALADGRPGIVSLYDDEIMHGFAVAVDFDAAQHTLTVQRDQLQHLHLPEVWWGAVTGPRAWGACPVFLVERGAPPGWSSEGRLHRALHRAAALLAGGRVAYRDCEGSRHYTRVPLAGRQAVYGLPAFDLLLADVGGAESLSAFNLIWRLDAQVSQLQHGRNAAAAFLHTIQHPIALEAAACCSETAALATDLLSRFWYRPSRTMATAADVLAAAGAQHAMIFWVGLEGEELERLARRVAVTDTPWGPIAMVDTIPRRREATALVARLRGQEERLARLLGELRGAL